MTNFQLPQDSISEVSSVTRNRQIYLAGSVKKRKSDIYKTSQINLAVTKYTLFLIISCSLFLANCQNAPPTQKEEISELPKSSNNSNPLFTLLSPNETNINFTNQLNDDPTTNRNILSFQHYYNGAGVAIGDINNDGLPDIFFSGNEVSNKLFLNRGGLKFEDISEKANINQNKIWSTGATMADVNSDGFLDIYVCQYGPNDSQNRQNRLYINNGDLTFTEKAAEYGLNDSGESTHAAFFDFDKDGDLDCYVLNKSKYVYVPLARVFEDLKKKENLEAASGNLYRNDGGKFTKITEEAGVLLYGFGLGLVVSDINKDGWQDIYVANDYSVPDFMFINNGDGTFTDRQKEYTKQISFYGMGADIADINNDALPDIAVVDMAANDHIRDKTLMASMDAKGFWYYINNLGYQYQYMFNSLQLNNGDSGQNTTFSNIANMAGVARSDWSWAALLADFDNDGFKDYFISNGFRRYARDNDFRAKMTAIQNAHGGTIPLEKRKELYDLMPQVKLPNLIYQNQKDLTFKQVSEDWGTAQPSYSNGAAYGDLDGDGDLDLVVNNIDQPCFIYRNNARENGLGNYFQIKLNGENQPIAGTKVTIYHGDNLQYQEWMNSRGYQSAVGEILHFGMGDAQKIDKIEIIWPNDKMQTLTDVSINQTLEIKISDATEKFVAKKSTLKPLMEKISAKELGVDFVHEENDFNDFQKEILLPHKQSTLGPFAGIADANGDGLEDFFIGNAASQIGWLYTQTNDSKFEKAKYQPWAIDLASEDMKPLFFDADSDGDSDLFIASGGGGDIPENSPTLQNRLYINGGNGQFQKTENSITAALSSNSMAKAADFDQDGDLDIFVGGQAVPGKYPYPSRSFLLQNNGRKFGDVTAEFAPDLMLPGIVKDFVWTDLNGDKFPDLIVLGEWIPIQVFINKNGKLEDASKDFGTDNLKGWWYSIAEADIDNDGDQDFIVGNIGMNTKFQASPKKPFSLYANDFDKNGTCDVVLSKDYKGKKVPARGRQCSSEQMPFITQKFPTFGEFANASLKDIYGEDGLKEALHLEATEFHSLVLINENGKFSVKYLPNEAQVSPINGIIANDLNIDGNIDLIVAGNNFDTEVETPRYDAGNGLVMLGKGDGNFESLSIAESGFFVPENVKDIQLLRIGKDGKMILVTNNDGAVEFFKIQN